MTVQGLGVGMLTTLMRGERRRAMDTSWLLFGPEEVTEAEEDENAGAKDTPPAWKFAAE